MMLRPLLLVVVATLPAWAQDGFQFSSPDNLVRIGLRPSIEALFWKGDDPAQGLIDIPDASFLAPRLSLALDAAIGEHLFFHANGRWDRGFDVGNEPDGEVRLDEIFLRVRAFDDERLNFQAGKFPTFFGAWVSQHDFYDDPFLLAPLPYGQNIGVQSRVPGAVAPAPIAARVKGTAPPISQLSKQNWASMLWGPVYAWGASVSGSMGKFDYAVEVKDSGLSTHADQWFDDAADFSAPTFTGRLGYRPDAAWAVGISASHGSYLAQEADDLLLSGTDRGDLSQNALGVDARWSHHDWILSGEIIASEFETLAAGDLRTLGWFLQARYKAAPGIWLSTRIGQSVANQTTAPDGKDVAWTPDIWRAELGAGWRINPHLLMKANYAYTHSDDASAGEHLFGLGVGLQW